MKTGDVVQDGQSNRYQVGLLLGRGLWGKTYRVRREHDHGDFVIKCPLGFEDLPPSCPDGARLVAICRESIEEQAELLTRRPYSFLPRLEQRFVNTTDEQVIVLERYPSSLEQRLQAGAPFTELLDILVKTIHCCEQLTDGPGFHGALRPTNILLDEKGEVLLADLATPGSQMNIGRLLSAMRIEPSYLAPEIMETQGAPPYSPMTDTYAIGMMLWRATMGAEESIPLPRNGLDKSSMVTLKDHLHSRLKQEESNPRFHTRLADRLAAVVNRAISRHASPSPPYRFTRLDELWPRVEEIRALVRPTVAAVGRIVLDRPPSSTVFTTDEKVRFSASVSCSPGVDSHDEIACGLAVFDRSTNERLRDVLSSYTVDRQPTGRFRFAFDIEHLLPGGYRVRTAFAIRDSGQEPTTKEVEFDVRAAPGYVPPPSDPPRQVLALHRTEEPTRTEPMITPPLDPRPVTQVSAPIPIIASPPPIADVAPAKPQTTGSTVLPPPEPFRADVPKPAPRTVPPPVNAVGSAIVIPSPYEAVPPVKPAPQRIDSRTEAPRPTVRPELPKPRPDPPKPKPEPLPPGLAAVGSWTDLPLPGSSQEKDDLEDPVTHEVEIDPFRPRSQWMRLVELIRGDAYVMFMIGAGVLILILVVALLIFK